MRILAYAQLLESYRSLTLESLGQAFGVSEEFVDRFVISVCPPDESDFCRTVSCRALFPQDVYKLR